MATKNISRESQLSINQYMPVATASRSNLVNGVAPFLYKTASIKALPPMILQKTGWRIKQLISHRRTRTFDDGETSSAERERRLNGKISRKPSKRRSWIGNGKTSIDVPFLEHESEHSQQQRDVTAHSSTSSLCSYDCATNDEPSHPLFPEPPKSPKILYLQPATELSGDAQQWRLIFPEVSTASPPSKSTFDLFEALAFEPTDDDTTPTPTIKNTREKSENKTKPDICEGVEQLIRETDEAFKTTSSAFEPDHNLPVLTEEINEVAKEELKPSERDLERHVLKKQKKVPATVTRTNSVSKAKRTKSTKKKARLLDLAAAGSTTPPITNSPPLNQRWTLVDVTDNISDIFSGRMFKMEVNEMIDTTRIGRIPPPQSPGRVKVLKQDSEGKDSMETVSSHGTDELPGTPNDPFDLESLTSRLGASGIVPATPDSKPLLSKIAIPPIIPEKSELRSPKRDSGIYVGHGINLLTHPSQDIRMPTSPSLRQRSRSYPRQPSLPTIQEISLLTSLSKQGNLRKPNSVPLMPTKVSPDIIISPATPDSAENHILLNSTPFTLTSPHFQHGSIRLPRGQKRTFKASVSPLSETAENSDTENNSNNSQKIGGRDAQGLDWTAFQMAISGGTGNYLMSGVEPEAPIEGSPSEIEEILEWWKEFGFEGVGRLVNGAKEASTSKHRRKKSKLSSQDVGISYEMDTNAAGETARKEGGMEKTLGRESLPPSPVDDLRVLDGEGGWLGDVVPMGFNLSHDLDDYLKWESAQADGVEVEK